MTLAAPGTLASPEPPALDIAKLTTSAGAAQALWLAANQRRHYQIDGVGIDDGRVSAEMRGAVTVPPQTFGAPNGGSLPLASAEAALFMRRQIVQFLNDERLFVHPLNDQELRRMRRADAVRLAVLVMRDDVF